METISAVPALNDANCHMLVSDQSVNTGLNSSLQTGITEL